MKKEKNKLKNKVKNEKGAITALVLASLLVITIVLINLYMMGSNKSNSQNKEITTIQEAYNYTEDKIELKYKNSIVFENINTANTNPKEAMPSNIKEIVENDANKGIVIKDQNNNEWVWIEVPKTTVFADLTIDTSKELEEQDYEKIKNKLIEYAGIYRNGPASQTQSNWKDEWYEECGLTSEKYTELYNEMLKNIYVYGGFWIGRYEAGIEGSIEDITKVRTIESERITIGESPKAISQKDAIPYNYIYCNKAQILAQKMTPDNKFTSSLMFGIQWDLICKFLEVKGGLTTADINADSTNLGNFSNVERIITSNNAKQSTDFGGSWTKISGLKTANIIILSTGASKETQKMNIYDFAGNVWEWTLENSFNTNKRYIHRGGGCNSIGKASASYRGNSDTIESPVISFRATLLKCKDIE